MTMKVDQWLHRRDIEALKIAHPVHRRKGEGDGYDFIEGELELAKVLGMAVATQAGKALEHYDRIVGLKSGSPVMATTKGIEDKLARDLEKLDPVLRESWNAGVSKQVEGIIGNLTERGARRAGAFRRLGNLPTRALIEEGMVASAKYFTNNHFNRNVLPSMVGLIQRQSQEGEYNAAFFRTLREHMDTRLKSVPYWRLVGNQAASRAYHYGLARSALADGYTGYTLNAVLDARTSDVCRSLNGKTFWLADGVSHLERVARANPSTMADEYPWLKLDDVDGRSSADLAKSGVLMPPFHGNCRTTVSVSR